MTQSKAGAVIFAKDMLRLAKFYEAVTGLKVTGTTATHITLESEWFQLVVHQIPQQIAHSIPIADPPQRRENTPIKLIFIVDSLADARRKSTICGGIVNVSETEWRLNQYTVCDGYDPEGNVFQLQAITAPT